MLMLSSSVSTGLRSWRGEMPVGVLPLRVRGLSVRGGVSCM